MPNPEFKGTDPRLIATAFNYSALVDYQEGAVVSRTIIDKPSGTVTVFAFDKGQGLSEHTAPFDALVQIIDGAAAITIQGALHSVAMPQAIIMPAGKPHALRAEIP
ncbi:MAG: cupin domain-containing protein, partial [Chitinivibrionales bacterium]|nr:cupin domain-containing protein [Chitinivibrionales bacterium]